MRIRQQILSHLSSKIWIALVAIVNLPLAQAEEIEQPILLSDLSPFALPKRDLRSPSSFKIKRARRLLLGTPFALGHEHSLPVSGLSPEQQEGSHQETATGSLHGKTGLHFTFTSMELEKEESAVSQTFKGSPYYAPPGLEILRF